MRSSTLDRPMLKENLVFSFYFCKILYIYFPCMLEIRKVQYLIIFLLLEKRIAVFGGVKGWPVRRLHVPCGGWGGIRYGRLERWTTDWMVKLGFFFFFFHFLKALLTLFLYAKENSLGPRLLMDRNQISIVVVFASISFKVLRYYVQAQLNKKASML